MLAGSLPDDPEARALVHIKSNVGRMGRTLGYSIDGEGRFSWTGESQITASDLLAAPEGPERSKRERAQEWLSALLKSGSREEQEIRSLAESEGFSYATLRRAKNALRVKSRKGTFGGSWIWSLPEDGPKDASDPDEGSLTV
jgi:putative DNA primase/helicase